MASRSLAPVAIFACRRPQHFLKLVDSLQNNVNSQETPLFIFVGGPKQESDWSKVEITLKHARKVRGFKHLEVFERFSENTGTGLIRSGVNQVLGSHDRIIVLEDDLQVRKDFLLYMNSALTTFRDVDQVSQVSGWNFGRIQENSPSKTFLFPVTTSWGWGTWARAWDEDYDVRSDFNWLIEKSSRIHKFNINENYNFLGMIERVLNENYDAWDAVWYLYCFRRSKLTVFPNSSMIINNGFDGSGLNFRRAYPWTNDFQEPAQSSFQFTTQICVSKEFEIYRKLLRNWLQTFWPDSDFKFFVDQLKRKRRQHLNYYRSGYYSNDSN